MRAANPDCEVHESNPLFNAIDLADASGEASNAISKAVDELARDLMSNQSACIHYPEAFASLYGNLLVIVPMFAAFGRQDVDCDTRATGAMDFMWAYALDAYNHACNVLGDDAERRVPLAYACIVGAFCRSMVERMRLEMAASREVLQ